MYTCRICVIVMCFFFRAVMPRRPLTYSIVSSLKTIFSLNPLVHHVCICECVFKGPWHCVWFVRTMLTIVSGIMRLFNGETQTTGPNRPDRCVMNIEFRICKFRFNGEAETTGSNRPDRCVVNIEFRICKFRFNVEAKTTGSNMPDRCVVNIEFRICTFRFDWEAKTTGSYRPGRCVVNIEFRICNFLEGSSYSYSYSVRYFCQMHFTSHGCQTAKAEKQTCQHHASKRAEHPQDRHASGVEANPCHSLTMREGMKGSED